MARFLAIHLSLLTYRRFAHEHHAGSGEPGAAMHAVYFKASITQLNHHFER